MRGVLALGLMCSLASASVTLHAWVLTGLHTLEERAYEFTFDEKHNTHLIGVPNDLEGMRVVKFRLDSNEPWDCELEGSPTGDDKSGRTLRQTASSTDHDKTTWDDEDSAMVIVSLDCDKTDLSGVKVDPMEGIVSDAYGGSGIDSGYNSDYKNYDELDVNVDNEFR